MNREEAKDLLPVIQAFAEGKAIEYSCDGEEWSETSTPTWNSDYVYRIKPEPKYRPFKSQEECWDEMYKHPDFGWITDGYYKSTISVKYATIVITISSEEVCFERAFNEFKFTDGEPFGIKEE